jgi:hypothetical protein
MIVCFLSGLEGLATEVDQLREELHNAGEWSSYDRTWFSGPNKQEIFIFILNAGE